MILIIFITYFVSISTVDNWEKHFETKLAALLNTASDLVDDEVIKLGKKDQEAYPLCYLKKSNNNNTTFRRPHHIATYSP